MSTAAMSAGGPQALVVGAGPVGLTAAHELTRRGVRVRIVEARSGPAATSRAIATHPRTLEVYDHMGVIDDVLGLGQRITAFTLFQRGKRMTRLDADYDSMPTRYPFTLAVDQAKTEEMLRTALQRRHVTVEWGTRVTAITPADDQVDVRLTGPDGAEERLQTPWLIGCDGGHSVVRKTLGLPLVGESSETWMLGDAQVTTDLPRNSIYWVRTGGVTMMMVPLIEPGRWRMLDTAAAGRSDDPDTVGARFTSLISAGTGTRFEVERPTWVSRFTFQQRMIARMRVGRCLLAGDAAHVHSPASGQGMNTGIQEAYNLAWKLAMVAHAQADESILDTYTEERVPVGQALLATTKRATRLIQLKNPVIDHALPALFAVVRTFAVIRRGMQRGFLGGVSGLNLSYAAGPLTHASAGSPTARPAPGERVTQVGAADAAGPGWQALLAELRELRWTLLVFPGAPADPALAATLQAAADLHKGWLSVRTVTPGAGPGPLPDDPRLRRTLGVRGPAWLLIRPDAYVAARGTDLDQRILAETFGRIPLAGRTERSAARSLPPAPAVAAPSRPAVAAPSRPAVPAPSRVEGNSRATES
jgi:NADPH-dependent dioxygenase